jgi:ATP-dependent RNA helicase DeaD
MEDISSFSQFNLSSPLLRAIGDMGFEEPTPIQALAIPVIRSGKDVTGQAQTGTGKTAAFGIPALEEVDPAVRAVQVLILCPTRELAIQTAEELARLAAYKKKITILPVYGGQAIERQMKVLKKGAHVVVGTPGRVRDHLERRTLSLSGVRMVILDEADQMLDMGFREEIEAILRHTPRDRQTVLFSATLPAPILEISRNFQRHPEFVRVPDRQLTVPQVEQQYLEVQARDKLEILSRMLDLYNPALALIFCNTKRGVDDLTDHLQHRGYLAEGLHGDKKQETRNQIMGKFRKGMIDVLVATDVASRGIDVENIDLVINYDVPQDVEYYVHRIGRTARAGRSGRSITFVSPREIYKLRAIQRYARIKIARIPPPRADDVRESKIRNITETVTRTIDEGGIERYVEVIERMMIADYTSLDIAAALLKLKIKD